MIGRFVDGVPGGDVAGVGYGWRTSGADISLTCSQIEEWCAKKLSCSSFDSGEFETSSIKEGEGTAESA